MLDVQVTIENEKVIVEKLAALMQVAPEAVRRGLKRAAVGIFDAAHELLSGGRGGSFSYVPRDAEQGGHASGWRKRLDNAGGYPVPVRTGHLRRSLFWIPPFATKQGDIGVFTTGPNEFIIGDAAAYADPVFHGKGSSAKYGPRDVLKDGLKKFNAGMGIKGVIEEEIRKEINKT